MGEVGAVPFLPFRQGFLFSSSSRRGTGTSAKERVGKRWQRVVVTANSHHLQRQQNPSTFSSTISTDIPLSESPPGEEWRIQMLPLDFLFLSVRPVIDMRLRCKSEGKDYPPGVPPRVTRVLELQAIKWELQGLENVLKPSHFALCVKGALYSDRRGIHSRLRGQLEMSISCILPPALSLIPEDVLKGVSESVLRRLVERMKQKVNESLLSDFREFRRESLKIQGRR
ncbi:uncharacterized protein LOC131230819 isoform X4 [Magnolia sinica]|uniref:uncharacterized protein LOC131230819 isoform X4 n=1 Tax=Magnolia sinica TaxID=86752 RepID=UPI002658D680|nr:uncharacterized protein LOC131230819 isoform X4 [Magnolia sinica]